MKFELKTEKENYSQSFSNLLKIFLIFGIFIIFCDFAFKLGIISRHYQIKYNCRLLSVEKTKTNFEKLSRLSSLKSKQRIWEFCRDIVK
ncbi:hypothetical protein CVS24_07925 [Prochlorococcus marinus str. XMU1419]|nr:hypothetical protein [Prochlorococcus marinus str. XMU1419]